METLELRPAQTDESRTYPETTGKASHGHECDASTLAIGSTLRRLRRELLQKILDRENERRVARSFATH